MIGCLIVWIGMIAVLWLYKKGKLPVVLQKKEVKRMILVLALSNFTATVLFGLQLSEQASEKQILRNTYGGGKKSESYEVTVEGELEEEPFTVELEAQEYTYEETMEMFDEVMEKLEKAILGENESLDCVEQDLRLVSSVEDYPVQIQWEVTPYHVLDLEGNILEDYAKEAGTLVELRGTLQYAGEKAVYTANAMVFPEVKTGKEQWIEALTKLIQNQENASRKDKVFMLPSDLEGKKVEWVRKQEPTGYYVLGLGVFFAVMIPIKKIQKEKEEQRKRQEQMQLDYPEIISKFSLLLSTGMTIKTVWTKIVQAYEENKKQTGKRFAYEEMCLGYREMQSGISEKEVYERFGQRCGMISFMKLGALLSQNLRKGSKGLADLLTLESIQAFEERKSNARKLGEEASAKLMLPMFIMLAIVLVVVIVPAFLSMQI